MPLWPASTPSSAHEAATTIRDHFTPEELEAVLSQYPLASPQSIQEFARGSRRSPKVIITTEQGKFLLKRRAPGKKVPQRVAFCHAIQLHLAKKHFPLPRLLATNDHRSFLQYHDNIYEIFEFVAAENYPGTLEATQAAGAMLANYHESLADFASSWHPAVASYHRAPLVRQSFERIASTGEISQGLMDELRTDYSRAGDEVEQSGLGVWPSQIVHADWHPGNLLFHGDRVAAVLDYDSARQLPIVLDIANGCLQFSMIDGPDNLDIWPDETDLTRFRSFIRGYRTTGTFSSAEAGAIPQLMIEAIIAEAVYPIAATGKFGSIPGESFLQMVRRKVRWLAAHQGDLTRIAEAA